MEYKGGNFHWQKVEIEGRRRRVCTAITRNVLDEPISPQPCYRKYKVNKKLRLVNTRGELTLNNWQSFENVAPLPPQGPPTASGRGEGKSATLGHKRAKRENYKVNAFSTRLITWYALKFPIGAP
jgi:hypothetical protein